MSGEPREYTFDEAPSRIAVRQWGEGFGVFRLQPGEEDDRIGQVVKIHETAYNAKVVVYGEVVDNDLWSTFDDAVQWLVKLTSDQREHFQAIHQSQERAYYRERREQERRDRPWWYNDDGTHIGNNRRYYS